MKDVTGFTLKKALDILNEEGITQIEVRLTTAPRNTGEEYNFKSRVVRQKTNEGTGALELVVCNL